MSSTKCGESDNGFAPGSKTGVAGNKCWGSNDAKTDGWTHALGVCYEVGARLCTESELKAEVSLHSGCGHDHSHIWSSTPCTTSAGTPGHKAYYNVGGVGSITFCSPDKTNNAVRCCADKQRMRSNKPVCDKFASGQGKCTSRLTCAQLAAKYGKVSWPTKYGSSAICGESDNGLGPGGKSECFGSGGPSTPIGWRTAQSICLKIGARMCTVEEVKADEARGTGCNHDGRYVWTSDDVGCKPGSHVATIGASTTKVPNGKNSICIKDSSTAAVRCCADTKVAVPCSSSVASSTPPAPAPAQSTGYLTPVFTQTHVSVDRGHATFQLSVRLGPKARNVYTMYGSATMPLHFPAAFQTKGVLSADVGGVNKDFLNLDKTGKAKFDSWLTVGITGGDNSHKMGMVGIDFSKWTETSALASTNGAIFWMNPPAGPSMRNSNIVIAQLTVPIGAKARPSKAMAAFSGKSVKGQDFSVHLDFTPKIRLDMSGH